MRLMLHGHRARSSVVLTVAALAASVGLLISYVPPGTAAPQTAPPASQPDVPAADVVQPEDLAKAIAGKDRPIVVCVAPRFLYDGAHVPGALFHGPGSTEAGLADLRQWAQGVPHDANIVLYCGCCPMTRCPNIRPALAALRKMGFTHVKVLSLPKDFHSDWIEKGYPVEKGQ